MVIHNKKAFPTHKLSVLLVLLVLAVAMWFIVSLLKDKPVKMKITKADNSQVQKKMDNSQWIAPSEDEMPKGDAGDQIRYGKALIANTAIYLGPKGKVSSMSNGMNCQNCHIDAGTKPYAFNFSGVASTYPKLRTRSEKIVSIAGRINSCFNRSLNGQSLDTTGKEMQAIISYIKWVGKDVPKGTQPSNAGVVKLNYLARAADPGKGQIVYATCESCHGKDGQGHLNENGKEYIFPPLWGPHSYNDGAGLYRLSNFAGFVKNNMPFGTTYKHPVLSDEEAWDVAAFVNSRPRPHKGNSGDYPILKDKPFDDPFGPYEDSFSEGQHKYGPYQPIISAKINTSKNSTP